MNSLRLAIAFALLCIFGTPVLSFAEEPAGAILTPGIDYRVENKLYWRGYLSDGLNFATAPARWDGADWTNAGLVVGGTAFLYVHDERIMNWMQTNRTRTADDIADPAKQFGNEMFVLPGLALLYGYGHAADDKRVRKTSLLAVESWFYSSLLTTFIKQAGHRHRPKEGDGATQWDGPSFGTSHLSFPSGHASTAWSIATVFATEYDDHWFIPPAAYTVATMVSWARVNDTEHWASDVFFSSCTGYFIGKAITKWHKDDAYGGLTVLPYYDGRTAALYIDWAF